MIGATNPAPALGSARASRAPLGASPTDRSFDRRFVVLFSARGPQFGGAPNWTCEARVLPRRPIGDLGVELETPNSKSISNDEITVHGFDRSASVIPSPSGMLHPSS